MVEQMIGEQVATIDARIDVVVKTIRIDQLQVHKLVKPTESGYTHAILNPAGETIAFLVPKNDGYAIVSYPTPYSFCVQPYSTVNIVEGRIINGLDYWMHVVRLSDPTRFVGDCTCRVAGVVGESVMIGGEDDCPVHGFGPDN